MDPVVADLLARLNANLRELFEERAAVREFDGGLHPELAEAILTGAQTVYLDDMSELGPLDVQVKKQDEVVGRNSGLDIIQAVSSLSSQAMRTELSRDWRAPFVCTTQCFNTDPSLAPICSYE
ncbi:hypothetical protein [Ottowia sp.]|jgi:hypothetical protein|uniref:hypothetical protein n=1 Tax=Ottowia sp. TaxID=1898956 RepID=UPI002C1C3EA5|nr:hypothetical protein [Ottowia sp.]HRN76893.1 hypothetical protein [Ottowia sp.]HRQ03651.1 hypothetical protein [Ottowia sp.]